MIEAQEINYCQTCYHQGHEEAAGGNDGAHSHPPTAKTKRDQVQENRGQQQNP